MARQANKIRISVGRQRIHANTPLYQQAYVSEMRKQMLGIRKNLLKVIGGIENASTEGLLHAMQPIFDESQMLVPVDTGKLKRSGFLRSGPTSTGTSAAIGYGKGGSPWYAPVVHEALFFHHESPTQAKFLSEAVNRHINEILPRYASYVSGVTGLDALS